MGRGDSIGKNMKCGTKKKMVGLGGGFCKEPAVSHVAPQIT